MCDYSLDFVVSRPAKVGDKLVTTFFITSSRLFRIQPKKSPLSV